MKKAFTLIELLVVIAIIAILAAILFPVFAQAKAAAKKTANLSNLKQLATGQQLYMSDADDNNPNALVDNGGNTGVIDVNDWSFANPSVQNAYASFYAPAMHPYMKSFALHDDPSMKAYNPYGYSPKNKSAHFTFNTYLHFYSGTAMASPANVVSFWPGFGNQRFTGLTQAKPTPRNKTTGFPDASKPQWRFQRSGSDCTTLAYSTYGTGNANNELYWDFREYGNQANLAYADGHAKTVNVKSGKFPWILDDRTGQPTSWWVNTADYANGCTYFSVLSPESEG